MRGSRAISAPAARGTCARRQAFLLFLFYLHLDRFDPDQVARFEDVRRLLGWGPAPIGVDEGLCPFHLLPREVFLLAAAQIDGGGLFGHLDNDCRPQFADRGAVCERCVEGLPVRWQRLQPALWAMVAMPFAVGIERLAHGTVGRRLLSALQGRVDGVAAGVGILAETFDQVGTHHLRDIGCLYLYIRGIPTG